MDCMVIQSHRATERTAAVSPCLRTPANTATARRTEIRAPGSPYLRTSVPPYLRTSVPPYLRTSVLPWLRVKLQQCLESDDGNKKGEDHGRCAPILPLCSDPVFWPAEDQSLPLLDASLAGVGWAATAVGVAGDRKSVVEGKRVDLGGRRII